VIDGEAVVLGVDGVADFDALHSRKHDAEVPLTPSISSRSTATIYADSRSRCARPILHGSYWRVAALENIRP
jgi:hypothetical protein